MSTKIHTPSFFVFVRVSMVDIYYLWNIFHNSILAMESMEVEPQVESIPQFQTGCWWRDCVVAQFYLALCYDHDQGLPSRIVRLLCWNLLLLDKSWTKKVKPWFTEILHIWFYRAQHGSSLSTFWTSPLLEVNISHSIFLTPFALPDCCWRKYVDFTRRTRLVSKESIDLLCHSLFELCSMQHNRVPFFTSTQGRLACLCWSGFTFTCHPMVWLE